MEHFILWLMSLKQDLQEFADKLLEYGVAVVPANGFGKDFSDFIRISFASSKENIAEAFVRIRKLLNDLNKEAC